MKTSLSVRNDLVNFHCKCFGLTLTAATVKLLSALIDTLRCKIVSVIAMASTRISRTIDVLGVWHACGLALRQAPPSSATAQARAAVPLLRQLHIGVAIGTVSNATSGGGHWLLRMRRDAPSSDGPLRLSDAPIFIRPTCQRLLLLTSFPTVSGLFTTVANCYRVKSTYYLTPRVAVDSLETFIWSRRFGCNFHVPVLLVFTVFLY
jgi:hypothetical protein